MTRLEIAEKLILMDKDASLEFLTKERDADIADAATRLTQSENLLQATYQVLARIGRLNLIDFI
jgi:flagellin-like hook-associated protein FlgL